VVVVVVVSSILWRLADWMVISSSTSIDATVVVLLEVERVDTSLLMESNDKKLSKLLLGVQGSSSDRRLAASVMSSVSLPQEEMLRDLPIMVEERVSWRGNWWWCGSTSSSSTSMERTARLLLLDDSSSSSTKINSSCCRSSSSMPISDPSEVSVSHPSSEAAEEGRVVVAAGMGDNMDKSFSLSGKMVFWMRDTSSGIVLSVACSNSNSCSRDGGEGVGGGKRVRRRRRMIMMSCHVLCDDVIGQGKGKGRQ